MCVCVTEVFGYVSFDRLDETAQFYWRTGRKELARLRKKSSVQSTSNFSQGTEKGFKWSNPADKIHNEKFIAKNVQDRISYQPSLSPQNELGRIPLLDFCTSGSGGLHWQKGLGPVPMASFDWLSWCEGLSVYRKWEILKSFVKNKTKQHKYLVNVLSQPVTENRLKTVAADMPEWLSFLQFPRGQTCDRKSIFVWEGSFHSTLRRLLCRLFHNPNRISPESRICYIWYKMLARLLAEL